jgi:hypothetical protein
MVCYSNKLFDLAQKRGWTNVDEENVAWDKNFVSWKFKDEAKTTERGTVASVSFPFWDQFKDDYSVQWNYDSATNSYKRMNGGQPHVDLETKEQLTAKNVVVQFQKETIGVDEHGHVLYGTTGEGKALVFQDGKVIPGVWRKVNHAARTKYFDQAGKEIAFNAGKIWIETVATDAKITY